MAPATGMNGARPVCTRQDQQTSAKRRQRKSHTIMVACNTGFAPAAPGMLYRRTLKKTRCIPMRLGGSGFC